MITRSPSSRQAMGRRSALGLFGAAPLVASGAFAGLAAAAPTRRAAAAGPLPPGLRPGGAVDRLIRRQAEQDLFSGTVLLADHRGTVLARSYGLADKQLSIPNRPDTIFGLASVTKAFTGVAVTQLAQRGKLSFDDALGTYLPGFPPEVADTVTIHQLLTHTSGMGDYLTDRALQGELGSFASAAEEWDAIMAVIRQQPLLFTPGSQWSYSNSGFFTLGAVVAQVSGQSYYEYVRQNIFRPAGMTRTGFYTKTELLSSDNVAHPYATRGQNGSGPRYDFLKSKYAPFIGGPDGGGWSTAPDMLSFARALWQRRLLDSSFTGIATSAKVPLPASAASGSASADFYCYGLGETVLNYQRIVWHNGGGPGISTDLDTYPDLGWVAIRLENYDIAGLASPIDTLVREILTTSVSSRAEPCAHRAPAFCGNAGAPFTRWSNAGEYVVERPWYAVKIGRLGEQARVPELALGTGGQEPPQLRFGSLSPPGGLPLHAAERGEVAVSVEELGDAGGADGADELVLQVLDARVKAQAIHVGTRPGRTDTGRSEGAPEDVFLPRVAQAGEPHARALGPELPQVAGDRVDTADRQDHDAFRVEVPAAADGERFEGDLVADALHQDDGTGILRLRQRHGRRLRRGRGAAHVTGEELAGKLAAFGGLHRASADLRLPACHARPAACAFRGERGVTSVSSGTARASRSMITNFFRTYKMNYLRH